MPTDPPSPAVVDAPEEISDEAMSEADRVKRRNRIQTIVAIVIVFVIFVVILPQMIDYGEVWKAMKKLTVGELLILAGLAMLRMGSSAALYAAVIPGLSFGNSAKAYLASNTVAEVAPPPADLAVRFGMYRSLGIDAEPAGVGIILSGIFSIGARLLIPVVALFVLIVAGVDDDTIWLLATVGACALIGAGAVVVLALKSEDFTRRFGDWIGKYVSALMVRFKREPIDEFGAKAVSFRMRVGDTMGGSWPLASGATIAGHVFTYAILLASMRFVGITADQIDWVSLLVAYAVVRLLTLVPLTPGGLGVAAAGYTFLLTKASETDLANAIAAASFMTRIWVWLFPMLVGFAPLLSWRKKMKEHPEMLTPESDGGALATESA